MSLLNISLITKTLTSLLSRNIQASAEWGSGTLDVTPNPPDKLKGQRILGCYLFHIGEDPYFKNALPQEGIPSDNRFSPMGVNLYYHMTAHSEIGSDNTGDAVEMEQLIMGLGMKTFHDYPLITDGTTLNGADPDTPANLIMTEAMRGRSNCIRIELLNIDQVQAMNYWSNSSDPMRLSAYYKVSAVMLEPEEAPRRVTRVLAYGTHIFTSGAPHLSSCSNTMTVSSGTETLEIDASPAEVPIDDPASTNQTIAVRGTGLTAQDTELLINRPDWAQPISLTGNWDMQFRNSSIFLSAVSPIQSEAGADIALTPGIYTLTAMKTVSKTLSNGYTKTFEQISNSIPFAIIPYLSAVTAISSATDTISIQSSIFSEFTANDITLYAGDEKLNPGVGTDPAAGEFVIDGSPEALRLQLSDTLQQLWNQLPNPKKLPIRILVNGVESAPAWIRAS